MQNDHNNQGYRAAKKYLSAAWDFHKKRIISAEAEKKESRPYLHDSTHSSIIFAIASVDMFFEFSDLIHLKIAANYLKEYKLANHYADQY